MFFLQQMDKWAIEENSDSLLGLIERTKVGEWMIKIWLPKAINISVIAAFFWNKPRFCPVLLPPLPQLPYSCTHTHPSFPVNWCHRCHLLLPTHPSEFGGAIVGPGLRTWDELIDWQVSRISAGALHKHTCAVGASCAFSFVKKERFKRSALNKWKNCIKKVEGHL